jgi:hypothetical protein
MNPAFSKSWLGASQSGGARIGGESGGLAVE